VICILVLVVVYRPCTKFRWKSTDI